MAPARLMPQLVVAQDVAQEAAQRFLAARPRTVALAGGSTPRALYERLAESDHPWDETDVFFGDERCVPFHHADSNYRLARDTLLSQVEARVHPMRGCDAASYEHELRRVFGDALPAFDLVLLGLGEDGHTASLFPGNAAPNETERWVVAVPWPDHRRLTLTLPVLSNAKLAMFLVAGAAKREALRRLLAGDDIPAAHVQAREVVVVADAEAAS